MMPIRAVLSVAVLGLMVAAVSAWAGAPAPGATFADPRSGHHATAHHRRHGVFPRFGVPVIVANPFVASVVASDPVVVDPPTLAYAMPTPAVTATPASAPLPSLVEYPAGWYQLRGDGVTAPYGWVWIPKPPPPPAAAQPDALENDDETRQPDEPSRAAEDVYRWTDDDGGVHLTNRLDSVPERYRGRM